MQIFSLIEPYLGTMLDIDVSKLEPGKPVIEETSRRLRCEQSFGYVHALYGIFFDDHRIAISVTPGARSEVIDLLARKQPDPRGTFEPGWVDDLVECIRNARERMGLSSTLRLYECNLYACNDALAQRCTQGDCRQVRDESVPPAEGLCLPTHCFPDGIVYGVVEDGRVVSVAYAHKTGLMEDQVADLGVETAAPYRRRGYAKTAVSAVTLHMTARGGEVIYTCSRDNQASIATAQSVGYQFYGRMIVVAAPRPDEK